MLRRVSPPPECLPAGKGRQEALRSLDWSGHVAALGAEEMGLGLAEDWGLAPALALSLTGCVVLLEP